MTGPIWRAGADRVAHALDTPRALRTACGERAVAERLAWPIGSRCVDCLRALGIVVEAPPAGWSQGELSEAFGK